MFDNQSKSLVIFQNYFLVAGQYLFDYHITLRMGYFGHNFLNKVIDLLTREYVYIQMASRCMKKNLNIPNHWENANQNHTPVRMAFT